MAKEVVRGARQWGPRVPLHSFVQTFSFGDLRELVFALLDCLLTLLRLEVEALAEDEEEREYKM